MNNTQNCDNAASPAPESRAIRLHSSIEALDTLVQHGEAFKVKLGILREPVEGETAKGKTTPITTVTVLQQGADIIDSYVRDIHTIFEEIELNIL